MQTILHSSQILDNTHNHLIVPQVVTLATTPSAATTTNQLVKKDTIDREPISIKITDKVVTKEIKATTNQGRNNIIIQPIRGQMTLILNIYQKTVSK